MSLELQTPSATLEGPLIGRPFDRVDGVPKTSGRARYSAEYHDENIAYAALVCATVARGRIAGIETGEAMAEPGVLLVLTHENAPPMRAPEPFTLANIDSMASGAGVNYLNTDEVHWNGQPVAVVVAESVEAARAGASLVQVSYTEMPAEVDFLGALDRRVPQQDSPLQEASGARGDAVTALMDAPFSVDLTFTTPPVHHNALEPHSTAARWDGDMLTVYEGTQKIPWVRAHLAWKFDVPVDNITVVSTFVGGGFGGKIMIWPGTILTVLAARVVGRPVRMMLTREAVYRTVGGRTPSSQRVALGADATGALTALVHESTIRIGRLGSAPEPLTVVSRHLYDVQAMALQQYEVELDVLSNTAMRAPGDALGSFGLESAIDELSYEVGIDPIELRLRNEPQANPIDGRQFSHRMLAEAWSRARDRFGWAGRDPRARSMRRGELFVGIGAAAAYHPSWQFPANILVRLHDDGRVLVRCGFHEMGMGGATAYGQAAAELLGVPFDAVTVEYGDSRFPIGPGAGGSGQTASVLGALVDACTDVRRQMAALAAAVHLGEDAGVTGAYVEILRRSGRTWVDGVVGTPERVGQADFYPRLLEHKAKWMKAACGAHLCEVTVDPDTGEIRVTRWLSVFDAGTIVNPKTAASQFRGGIVMGIGMALMEETLVDPRNGRIMNANLADYHVPVHRDVPRLDVEWLGEPDPTMPLGALGIGEVGITGVAAAVANAVRHATGVRVRDLPVTLDKVIAAL